MSKARPSRGTVPASPARAGRARPADAADRTPPKGVQSVDIALSVVRAIEEADGPLALSEIAARSGLQPSKAHHHLVSLKRTGLVKQMASGRYDLGEYALQLGLSALNRLDALELAAEALADFREATGEACFLSVWGNRGPTIIRYLEGSRPVTVEARAGMVLPVLTSATGHVFLGWLAPDIVLPIAAAEGSGSPDAIETIRMRTRAAGLGRAEGDLLPRIAAVSVPVLGHEGQLVCSLTSLGWRGEFDLDAGSPTVRAIRDAAGKLSAQLGLRRCDKAGPEGSPDTL